MFTDFTICPSFDLLCGSFGPCWESFRRHHTPLQMGSAWKSQLQLCSNRPWGILLTSLLIDKFHGILITMTRATALWFTLVMKDMFYIVIMWTYYSNVLNIVIKQAFKFLHWQLPKPYFLNMCVLYILLYNFWQLQVNRMCPKMMSFICEIQYSLISECLLNIW